MAFPAKPLERKRLEGNPGHQKLPSNGTVIAVPVGVPPVPRGFRAVAKQEWARIFTVAGPWIAPTDIPLITMFCQACDEREQLRRVIRKEGLFTTGSMGQVVSHPAVAQVRTLERQMTSWLSLCGFTPSDRSRLGLAEVQRVSKLDEFMAKRSRGTVVEMAAE